MVEVGGGEASPMYLLHETGMLHGLITQNMIFCIKIGPIYFACVFYVSLLIDEDLPPNVVPCV